jgi:hypothetical protein
MFRRGPTKEVAHQVELFLLLEAVGMGERRHGGDCRRCEGKDHAEAGREESTRRKEQIAKVREKTKGRCSVWRRQVRKGSQSLRRMPLNKAVPPLNSTATEGNSKSQSHQAPASYPL